MAAVPSVKLVRPSALQVAADEPFVLEIHIPVTLPHDLDPSLPAPPYHDGTVSPEDFRDHHALPLFRGLIAQILSHLIGSEQHAAAVSELEFEVRTRSSDPLRLYSTWDASAVFDKENDFDFEAGYWKDKHGVEHRGAILSFEDVWDRIIIHHAFELQLVCGAGNAESWKKMNPRVLRLDVVSAEGGETTRDLEDKVVVFEVREYTEASRRRVNEGVAISRPVGLPLSPEVIARLEPRNDGLETRMSTSCDNILESRVFLALGGSPVPASLAER